MMLIIKNIFLIALFYQKIPAELIWLCRMPIKVVVSVDDSSNLFWVFWDSLRIDLYRELLKNYNIIRLREQ